MKFTKWIIVFFLLLFMTGIPFTVSAFNSGLDTEALSKEEISKILEERQFVKITSYVPQMAKCFDVREDHMVVVGAGGGEIATIAVYDDCGNFQYGFQTEEYGSFRVMWSGDMIAYYSIRGASIFTINEDGEITDVQRVPSSRDNSVYDQKVLCATTKTMGASTYQMTNGSKFANIVAGSYKKIVKTDENGTTIVYDASANQRTHLIITVVISFIITPVAIIAAYQAVKKIRNSGTE